MSHVWGLRDEARREAATSTLTIVDLVLSCEDVLAGLLEEEAL